MGLAYFFLPVSPLPQVDYPQRQRVMLPCPAAAPRRWASSVATPLERQFGRIAGVTEMTSSSSLGTTNITLVFDLSRDINAAARDVQAAINAAAGYLPANLPSKPTYRKINPADAPIMILTLTSDVYGRPKMYDAASSILAQKLSQVDGVGQVSVGGSALPGVRVEVDPLAISTMKGYALADRQGHSRGRQRQHPQGVARKQSSQNNGRCRPRPTSLFKAEQYQKSLIIAYKNGAPVRVSRRGLQAGPEQSNRRPRRRRLGRGHPPDRLRVGPPRQRRTPGTELKPAVLLVIFRQPGANIIQHPSTTSSQTAAGIAGRDSTPGIKLANRARPHRHHPGQHASDVQVHAADQRRRWSSRVVFVFLRNIRATMIPAAAVPISLIGTFAVMYLLGYSLDNLSLMALTIATGFVVDDAIVVVENVTRHLEEGL